MRPSRRDFLRLSAAGAALAAHAPIAGAQDSSTQVYPTRPVRIVSGFPPGGISDTYARLIAQWLSEQLGEQFIVENRPGAGSTLAAEYVAKAAPDGYTLLLTTSADAWNERKPQFSCSGRLHAGRDHLARRRRARRQSVRTGDNGS